MTKMLTWVVLSDTCKGRIFSMSLLTYRLHLSILTEFSFCCDCLKISPFYDDTNHRWPYFNLTMFIKILYPNKGTA